MRIGVNWAVAGGVTSRRNIADALKEKLLHSTRCGSSRKEEPPWMAGFGALSDLTDENRRVLEAIEEEFERLPPEDAAR